MNELNHQLMDAFWASLFTAIFGLIGWLGNRAFARMDKRHERAENKFEDVDANIADVRYETKLRPWHGNNQGDTN